MPAAPADSGIYGALFGDAETARLFSDSAELRAMLLVEGALAALQNKRPDEHNQLIADLAGKQQCDVIAFAQFSMSPALKLAAQKTKTPILTTPDSAVAKLKAMLA